MIRTKLDNLIYRIKKGVESLVEWKNFSFENSWDSSRIQGTMKEGINQRANLLGKKITSRWPSERISFLRDEDSSRFEVKKRINQRANLLGKKITNNSSIRISSTIFHEKILPSDVSKRESLYPYSLNARNLRIREKFVMFSIDNVFRHSWNFKSD